MQQSALTNSDFVKEITYRWGFLIPNNLKFKEIIMTIKTIRDDLKNIRYYYSRKDIFDQATSAIGKNAILKTIALYNEAICLATPRLYDLYVSLYLQNNTQESLSNKLGYSIEHISRLNKQLVEFFQQYFKEKGENKT